MPDSQIAIDLHRAVEGAHDPGGKRRIPLPSDWVVDAAFGGEELCFRYSLSHCWGSGPMALWLMMNPSTADYRFLDPTVSKTGRISKRLGFGGQFIGNVAAYRATDKMRLLGVKDPLGPENHAAILDMASKADMIIVAHGKLPGNLQSLATDACDLLRNAGYRLHILRLTLDGVPSHPLARGKGYIPESTIPQLWRG